MQSRLINDESPVLTFQQAEKFFGDMSGFTVALLGTAYRFNSEDTRNSPTLSLANYLRERDINYIMHDPYVKEDDQNLLKFDQEVHYTRNLDDALENADYIIMCTAHADYTDKKDKIISASNLKGVMDACNIFERRFITSQNIAYAGIGRGEIIPEREFIEFVYKSFREMEKGLALELIGLIDFYNKNFVSDQFNEVRFDQVQKLASTCSTGCEIANPGIIKEVPEYCGFKSRLVLTAKELSDASYG
jgi:hypothetical protein